MKALPSKQYSGHRKATVEEGDPGTPGKESGERNVEGFKYRRWKEWHETEPDGAKWFVGTRQVYSSKSK